MLPADADVVAVAAVAFVVAVAREASQKVWNRVKMSQFPGQTGLAGRIAYFFISCTYIRS